MFDAKSALTALAALFLFAPLASADEDPIHERHELMESVGDAAKPVGAMLREESEFDADVLMESLSVWKKVAGKFGGLFPEGTETGGGVTVVGNDNMLMANAHVAHDCIVGSRIILANNVMLAGHVRVQDGAILNGGAGVHHFTTVGAFAYVGGLSRALRVAGMAEAAGLPCVPHSANLSMVTVFTLHMMGALENAGPYVEFSIEPNAYYPWQEGLFRPALVAREGKVQIPDGPGWGVEVEPGWLAASAHRISALD